ncbi:Vanillate O-demethylase oxidoreductase [Acidovorax sp. Leaf76]|uniref:PDR/VanB family oxidoreductase n=1 Tax=unclassified Acidovorax TaxID=2684926 RepID=UPI0007002726|nr:MULTISPECIES: PDR/VanB family oxidoreductase [unclassified Acidovorax]KQO26907.1 Vanillate O-demethylase oxidoreductase [Acidovorax sp. Leaf76]KQO40675.1 Vanillate O-demethylase oxidoreductase [Acidovorax sp. Leaf84]KQS42820.1 Vanillate O-demethylase oxidoreductase [Acidovorax sp. Leaf191]
MTAQETFQVRVAKKTAEAEGIASFELARLDGQPLPPFSAGSHIDVHVPGGTVRQYSLCNASHEQHRYRIAVLRDPASRGGSVGMHDRVNEGDVITISTPRNHFALHPAQHTLLLAGGIGVTPLLCMADRLARTGAGFALHYCTRSAERTAFAGEITASPMAPHVHFHFDAGAPEQKLDLASVLAAPGDDKRVYVCGPAGFIDHVVSTAQAMGWAQDRIHLEYFAAPAQDTSGDEGFEVRIASTGKTYAIAPDISIVDALRGQGIDIMTSCEQGVCGTCITRVLEGKVDHRDMYLTDEEKASNEQFMPCCSRARSKLLVLDL